MTLQPLRGCGRSPPWTCCGGCCDKTRLEHAFIAVALDLLRLEAYWNGTPLDRRRTSHLARLELSLVA